VVRAIVGNEIELPNGRPRHAALAALTIGRLTLAHMDAASIVHRRAFDDRLPWLAGIHTPEEDRRYFRERVFQACEVWGDLGDGSLRGIIAFRSGWIDQLYVLPKFQGQGIGTELLGIAQSAFPRLQLWTFQRNLPARRFYERRQFVLVKETDGSENEENEPDALYLWSRQNA
jgi:putative acetyltransferase